MTGYAGGEKHWNRNHATQRHPPKGGKFNESNRSSVYLSVIVVVAL
jgi:hypothetical protein